MKDAFLGIGGIASQRSRGSRERQGGSAKTERA
jgi:hypothetical protein